MNKPGGHLVEWLRGQYGKGRRYRSARQFSMAAGLSPNVVANILERGQAAPDTLAALARVVGVSPVKVFVLIGWLAEHDQTDSALSNEERRLLSLFRAVEKSPRLRRFILEAAELAEVSDGLGRGGVASEG